MRVFKFWCIAETTVLIDGVEKTISGFGGSNHSENDAVTDGYQRLEAVKRRIDEWIKEYDSRSQGYSTCRLVKTVGSHFASPLVRYHDERTRALSKLPLA